MPRRGGESARLTIEEWKDGLENKWIDKQRLQDLDDVDRALIKSLKVTHLTGKSNNHLVPVLIPEDTVEALQFLRRQGWTNIQNLIVRGLENFQIFNSGGRGVGKIE